MSWQQALERTVTGLGYDLVDVERSAGGLLRVTIDRLPSQVYGTGLGEAVLVEDCRIGFLQTASTPRAVLLHRRQAT